VTGRLLDDLPAVLREDPFLGRFLVAFEKVLVGVDDGTPYPDPGVPARAAGIEQLVAGLAGAFDAATTPAAFLPWLASWVALTLRADLDEAKQRDFLAGIAQRYRRRGTLGNLVDLISILTVGRPTVTEDDQPHHFTISIVLPPQGGFAGSGADYADFIDRQTTISHALIELEKPAHTTYQLNPIFPSLQIGVHSTVGVDTLLGTATS
jgi:phage tail-like protein